MNVGECRYAQRCNLCLLTSPIGDCTWAIEVCDQEHDVTAMGKSYNMLVKLYDFDCME